jgi:hypothetical protein
MARGLYDDPRAPSLFEGINARYYRASEISRSFVPSQQFEHLAVRQHTVVVGPRGSGKTTLLRMLHPECLRLWNHPVADSIRNRIEFTAAYVPADKVWRQQIDAASATLSVPEQTQFAAHILSLDAMAAMLRAIEVRITPTPGAQNQFRLVQMSDDQQSRLAAELANGWGLKPTFLDLGSLRVALRSRRIEARQWCDNPTQGHGLNLAIPWDEAVLLAVDSFESATGIRGEAWAVLFDELEIVPGAIRDEILSAARGADPRMLLKISLSPWLKDYL